MSRSPLTVGLVISALATSVALAQPGRPGAANRAGGSMPEIGSTLPEITLYDEHGKPFSTANLRGQHAVIVFGCLT